MDGWMDGVCELLLFFFVLLSCCVEGGIGLDLIDLHVRAWMKRGVIDSLVDGWMDR